MLDDIWTAEQLGAFAALTAEGGLLGRLVTTRNDELAGEHAHKVEALKEEEALRVLAGYMGKTAEDEGGGGRAPTRAATRLVEMCRGNPAMLRSVAALCRKQGRGADARVPRACRRALEDPELAPRRLRVRHALRRAGRHAADASAS